MKKELIIVLIARTILVLTFPFLSICLFKYDYLIGDYYIFLAGSFFILLRHYKEKKQHKRFALWFLAVLISYIAINLAIKFVYF